MNERFPIQSPYIKIRNPAISFIAILFLVAIFASGCIVHDRDNGEYGNYGGPVVVKPRVVVDVPAPVVFIFNDHHRHMVREYYHRHPHHHHGKKHKHRKKWKHKRKAHLHPGVQMQVIPVDLARQLPPAPRGTRYIYDDDQVLLVDVNTRVVLDFINISISTGPQVVAVPEPVVFTFNDHHRYTVREYYKHHRKNHKKKHKKKHKWEHEDEDRDEDWGDDQEKGHHHNSVHKRDILPPEIQMQAVNVDLVRQLPPSPQGTRFIYYDDQVLLIDVQTRMVLDFINISVSAGF